MNTIKSCIIAFSIIAAAPLLTSCGTTGTAAEAAAPKTVVKTKTVTIESTPKACLQALSAAERMSNVAADFVTTTMAWPNMVTDAFKSGTYTNVALGYDVLDREKTAISEMKSEASRAKAARSAFDIAATICRDHSTNGDGS